MEVNSRSKAIAGKGTIAKRFFFLFGVFNTKESSVERKDLLGWYKFAVFLR